MYHTNYPDKMKRIKPRIFVHRINKNPTAPNPSPSRSSTLFRLHHRCQSPAIHLLTVLLDLLQQRVRHDLLHRTPVTPATLINRQIDQRHVQTANGDQAHNYCPVPRRNRWYYHNRPRTVSDCPSESTDGQWCRWYPPTVRHVRGGAQWESRYSHPVPFPRSVVGGRVGS